MQELTTIGENLVSNIASRYHLSYGAVMHMLVAVNNGAGTMAQFNCPELGGSGQWMRGGMIMVGDIFNNNLKSKVGNLCNELSEILANNQIFPMVPAGSVGSNQWWPVHLGTASSSGSQNNLRYAVFPNRLAVELNGQVSIYDTLNHNIGGVSQQQGGNTSLSFSSQFGTIAVNNLPLLTGQGLAPVPQTNFTAPPVADSNFYNNNSAPLPENTAAAEQIITAEQDVNSILDVLEKLARLRDSGALTEEDFNDKKKELLSRI